MLGFQAQSDVENLSACTLLKAVPEVLEVLAEGFTYSGPGSCHGWHCIAIAPGFENLHPTANSGVTDPFVATVELEVEEDVFYQLEKRHAEEVLCFGIAGLASTFEPFVRKELMAESIEGLIHPNLVEQII